MNIRIIENASPIIAKALSKAIDNAPEFFTKNEFFRLADTSERNTRGGSCPYFYPIGYTLAKTVIEVVGEVNFKRNYGGELGTCLVKEKIYKIKEDVKKPTPKDVEDLMYQRFKNQLTFNLCKTPISNIPTSELLAELNNRHSLYKNQHNNEKTYYSGSR